TDDNLEEAVETVEEEETPVKPVEVAQEPPVEPSVQEGPEPNPTPRPTGEVAYQPLGSVSPLKPRYASLPPVSLAQVAIDLQREFPPLPPIDWTELEKLELPAPPTETPRIDVSQLTEEEIKKIEERETERREQARQNPSAPVATASTPIRTTTVKPTPYQSNRETLYDSGPYAEYMPYADPDQDGVPNKDDECPDLPGSPNSRGCPEDDPRGKPSSERVSENPEVEAFERVYFDYDKSYLNGKARVSLNRVARFLRENTATELEIWGHADANGSNPYNDRLSERRCKAVEAYLIGKGIDPSRLSILPLGERLPLASNATDEGREKNRRVELVLVDR
ncbi:MAG: OmpA family protein, partial [Bacteroidota bacterium]